MKSAASDLTGFRLAGVPPTFLFLRLLLAPLPVPGLSVDPVLLGVGALAEVNPLCQLGQVLGHGQRRDVRLRAMEVHFLHLLLTGRLDADPDSWTARHDETRAAERKRRSQHHQLTSCWFIGLKLQLLL